MSTLGHRLPVTRAMLVADILLAAWTVAWIAMGIAIAGEVKGLANLSDTVSRVGGAVQATGIALEALDGLPFVGDRLADPAAQVRDAGDSALASGRSSRESIDDLSTKLGVAVALVPTIPLLAVYTPLRVMSLRERRAADRLSRHGVTTDENLR